MPPSTIASSPKPELPRWRKYKARGAFISARIFRAPFGKDEHEDVPTVCGPDDVVSARWRGLSYRLSAAS